MWLVEVFSQGDLTQDDYLKVSDPDNDWADEDGYVERYLRYDDVTKRIEFLNDVIERAKSEIEFLEKYGSGIVNKKSWTKVEE